MFAKITRWLGVILVIGLVASFVIDLYEPHSRRFYFWVPSASRYNEILDDHNKDLSIREVGIGDFMEFKMSSKSILPQGDRKSIGRDYALDDVFFTPSDVNLIRWVGEEIPRDWPETLSGDMKLFQISMNIQIPQDPSLMGRTIDGVLNADVI
jgi:hypothetical protein